MLVFEHIKIKVCEKQNNATFAFHHATLSMYIIVLSHFSISFCMSILNSFMNNEKGKNMILMMNLICIWLDLN